MSEPVPFRLQKVLEVEALILVLSICYFFNEAAAVLLPSLLALVEMRRLLYRGKIHL